MQWPVLRDQRSSRGYCDSSRRDHADGVRVMQEYAWASQVLGGLLERVRRMTRVYLFLGQRGYAAEGRFLVGSALEHAVPPSGHFSFATAFRAWKSGRVVRASAI